MIFATGGSAKGEISIKSSSAACARRSASARVSTPKFSPSSPTTRREGAVIALLILFFGCTRCVIKKGFRHPLYHIFVIIQGLLGQKEMAHSARGETTHCGPTICSWALWG